MWLVYYYSHVDHIWKMRLASEGYKRMYVFGAGNNEITKVYDILVSY